MISGPAAAAVTFNFGLLNARGIGVAQAGPTAQGNTDESVLAFSTPVVPLQVEGYFDGVASKNHGRTLLGEALADEVATATFSGAASGTVNFSGYTKALITAAAPPNSDAYAYDAGSILYYFTVDAPSILKYTYNLIDSSDGGVYNPYHTFIGYSSNLISDFAYANTNGSQSVFLGPGTYGINIYVANADNHDFTFQYGLGAKSSTSNDTFTFNIVDAISAAPEPATWAMMLLGFFGIGAALRRSRQRLGMVPA